MSVVRRATRRGTQIDFQITTISVAIILFLGLAILTGIFVFSGQAVVTSAARSNVENFAGKADYACSQGVDITRDHDFSSSILRVNVTSGGKLWVTLEGGDTFQVAPRDCTTIAICQAGTSGATCPTGGKITAETVTVDIYESSGGAIIDVR